MLSLKTFSKSLKTFTFLVLNKEKTFLTADELHKNIISMYMQIDLIRSVNFSIMTSREKFYQEKRKRRSGNMS